MDEATRIGLVTAAGGLGWKVIDYSSHDGFEWLWNEPSLNEWLKGGGAKNLLIVWDDMPPALDMQPVNISAELTPFDWIVSISHHLLQRDAPPALRVIILDGHSFRVPEAFGCRMADSLITALPWLGVVRLLPNGQSRSVADGWDEVRLKSILDAPSEIETLAGGAFKPVIESFVHAWTGNLARAESHHDVNNLLGPILLLEGFGARPKKHRGRDALLEHTRRLGLAPTGTMIDDKAWFDAKGLADTLGRPIRFVLVDDQVNNGWGDVIAAALGIQTTIDSSPVAPVRADVIECLAKDNGVEVWATTNADPVITMLKTAVDSGTDQRFRLRLTSCDSQKTADNSPLEVLLFDLRLASDGGEEIEYFSKVLDLAEALTLQNTDGSRSWRPIINTELNQFRTFKDLREWVNNYAREPNAPAGRDTIYLELLTFLARIVATIDMSLPIIVFSSTGQRGVVEEFKNYGNLITAFEKPRLLGYRSEDLLRETKSKWSTAIEQAADILRGRLAVQRTLTEGSAASAPVVLSTVKKYLLELYIDETGSEFRGGDVTVGGLIVIGPQNRTERFSANAGLDNEINRICSENPDRFKKLLRSRVQDLAARINAASAATGIYVAVVTLTGSWSVGTSFEPQPGAVDSELEADNLYRDIISALTEIAVYHFGADICGNGDLDYKVYMATRVNNIDTRREKLKAEDIRKKWGIQTVNVGRTAALWDAIDSLENLSESDLNLKNVRESLIAHASVIRSKKIEKIRYFDFSAPRPIIQTFRKLYASAKFQPQAQHARAYTVNRAGHPTLPFHLLADAMIDPKATGAEIALLRQNGFAGEYNFTLRMLLNATRQAANGFVGDAIATAVRCAPTRGMNEYDVRRRLWGRLARFASDLSSMEFMRAVNCIRRDRSAGEEQPRVETKGTVSRCRTSEQRCWIRTNLGHADIECELPITMGSREHWLVRGDQVIVTVIQSNESGIFELALKDLVWLKRHPEWDRLEPGYQLEGRIVGGTSDILFVNVGAIDAFVKRDDVRRAWGQAREYNGMRRFAVVEIDKDLPLLRVAPSS